MLFVTLHLLLLFFQFLLGFSTTLFGTLPGFGGTVLAKLATCHFLIPAFAFLLFLFFALFQVFILTLHLIFAPLIQVLSFFSHHLGSLFGLFGHHLSGFFHFLSSLLGSLFGLFQQTLTFSLALTLCKSKGGTQNKSQHQYRYLFHNKYFKDRSTKNQFRSEPLEAPLRRTPKPLPAFQSIAPTLKLPAILLPQPFGPHRHKPTAKQ